MNVQYPSAAIPFPLGVAGGITIDPSLLYAVASEAALRIQQDDFEGLEHIYDHLDLPPAARGAATRQIGVASSMSRLFGKSDPFLNAVGPTAEAVEKLAMHFERTPHHNAQRTMSMTQTYLQEIERLSQERGHASIALYVDSAIEKSIRAGDIPAAFACFQRFQELDIKPDTATMNIRFAEHAARLGLLSKASGYMASAFPHMWKAELHELDQHLITLTVSYLRIGAIEGADILIQTIQDDEFYFFMLLEKADALMKFHHADKARHCLLSECLQSARSAAERTSRITKIQAVIDALIEYGFKTDAAPILDEITTHLSNRDNDDREHVAWAAKAMHSIDIPVAHIVEWLSDGWLVENHKDFQGDPAGLALRQSQAYLVRERWNGKLDHLADELLAAG